MKAFSFTLILLFITLISFGQKEDKFNGLNMNLGDLSRLSDAKTRSISPENPTLADGFKAKDNMLVLIEPHAHFPALPTKNELEIN